MPDRIVVGISGASGAPVAVAVLEALRALGNVEVHLVVTGGAALTIKHECPQALAGICGLADVVHDNSDVGAAVASGSFRTRGMIVVPCSMKTLAGIASGYSDNLLLRAADVCLKERRRLVLGVRETPFSLVHIENMRAATLAGAVVMPLALTYYTNPESVGDMTRHMAGKALDLFGLEPPGFRRWRGGGA